MHLRAPLSMKISDVLSRHCERSEAISTRQRDCFVADAPRNDMIRPSVPFFGGMTRTERLRHCPSCPRRVVGCTCAPDLLVRRAHPTMLRKRNLWSLAVYSALGTWVPSPCGRGRKSVFPFRHFPIFQAVARTNPSNQHHASSRDCRTDSITRCCSSSVRAQCETISKAVPPCSLSALACTHQKAVASGLRP